MTVEQSVSGALPPLAIAQFGVGALSSIINGFGQAAQNRRYRKYFNETTGDIRRQLGTQAYDPNTPIMAARRAAIPRINQFASDARRQYGVGQGRAASYGFDKQLELEDQISSQITLQELQDRLSRDTSLRQTLASLTSAVR